MSTIALPSGALAVAPPHGLAAVRAQFGPIVVENEAIVAPAHWESVNMKKATLPGVGKPLYINRAIEPPLREALARCVALGDGYTVRTIGCFAPRGKRTNPAALSMHSWGCAVDINADTNRMGHGMPHDIPDAWVAIFKDVGWTWGGEFPTPDPQHFQWCSGY